MIRSKVRSTAPAAVEIPAGLEWGVEPMPADTFNWLVEQLGEEWDVLRVVMVDHPDDPRRTITRDLRTISVEQFLAEERAAIASGVGTYPRRQEARR
ncbi:hypothetical protein [Promicromonospora sp. NFX87]|uniref:hypothetical protein n=1 Tax=Promicromonospora sp. NFX87 TaxID=3402691 RepID=UPI003AFAB3E3